jgi:phosphate starvation-inducible PhoH-like protein
LDDSDLVSGVCGSNDGNLLAIEGILGKPVFVRGNELRAEDLSFIEAERFRGMVDALILAVREGETPTPEYVRSFANLNESGTASSGGSEPSPSPKEAKPTIRDSLISIPHGFSKVFPKTANQAAYVQALRNYDITFCVGPAGTGKTYLAIAHALYLVLSKKMRKLVLTRPVVEAGESLGFLPGDLAQKINPYLKPLYDAMESLVPYETIHHLEETGCMEIAPLAYMRGRSLNDSVIILDEAQNTTREQMKMFLTRLGNGSKAIVTGDTTQIDLPKRIESGLLHAVRILSNVEGIRFSYLNTADVVRNPLIKKIIAAYEKEGDGFRVSGVGRIEALSDARPPTHDA